MVFIFFSLLLNTCSLRAGNFGEMLEKLENEDADQRQQLMMSLLDQYHEFPVIEDSLVWFVYRDSINKKVFLTGDMTGWRPDSIPLRYIDGTAFHVLSLAFPPDARIEYKFVAKNMYRLDPLNKHAERGAFGQNSVFFMPEYRFSKELLLRPERPVTSLDSLQYKSSLKDTTRLVLIYRHPQAAPASPLLIFLDGSDYINRGSAQIILDNLIADRRIPAVNAVFIDPVNRMHEFWLNEQFLSKLFNELLPYLKRTYNLSPLKMGMGGVSLGGVTSLHALLKYGYQLDFVFSQSGSLQIEGNGIIRLFNSWEPTNSKIYLDFGFYENMRERHEQLREILMQKNVPINMQMHNEGHNWGNWRAHLPAALEFVLKDR